MAIDVNRRYTEVRFGTADAVTTSPTPRPKPGRTSSPTRPGRKPTAPATSKPAPSRTPSVTPSARPSPSAPDRRPHYRVTADGGVILVAYSSSRIDVIDAAPRVGHVLTVNRRSNTLVIARLTSNAHTSIITAYWNDGPAAQIVEEYRGGLR